MSAFDDEDHIDPYELVEQFWPYDGPYSDERTAAATLMISRLGRYLNNATQKTNGLTYVAMAGRVLGELHATVVGYEQLLGQLARFLTRQAEIDPSVYDDRRDRPGAMAAHEAALDVARAKEALVTLSAPLGAAAQQACHLGSE